VTLWSLANPAMGVVSERETLFLKAGTKVRLLQHSVEGRK